MTEEDDQDLRHRFLALREADARRTPSFAALWRRAQARHRGPRRRRALRWALATGAACAVVLALVRHDPPPASPVPMSPGPSLGVWRPPTDFLLRTPALEVLTSVPVLGTASLPPRPSPFIERSRPS